MIYINLKYHQDMNSINKTSRSNKYKNFNNKNMTLKQVIHNITFPN